MDCFGQTGAKLKTAAMPMFMFSNNNRLKIHLNKVSAYFI